MEIKIKIEGIEQLTEALALIGSALAYKHDMIHTAEGAVDVMLDITDKVDDLTEEEEVKKEVVEKVVSEVVQAPKEDVKTSFTREDVRAAFVAKNSPSTRNKLKAILDKFGAPNISELEEKYFDGVMKELEAV